MTTTIPRQPLDRFDGRKYINVESYKKNGEPKRTPVQSISDGSRVYFRTGPETWKVKRIKRNPHVRIVLSDRNGKPEGEWLNGDARILEGAEYSKAEALFRQEYGSVGNALIGLVGRLRGEKLSTIVSVEFRSQ